MKIAIVVQGRFHAFDFVQALINRGHEVTLFTNYPAWAVARFGLPRSIVRSAWRHGGVSRLAMFLGNKVSFFYPEASLHQWFGRWAAKELVREQWDVVHSWSGISEELLLALRGNESPLKLLIRLSTHIRAQARLLEEEERRTGGPIDRPSPWIIAREEREYPLADRVLVLSSFSFQSFIEEGIPPERLYLLTAGADVATFRPTVKIVAERCTRILSGKPLRVLNVGTFCFRKGMWDIPPIINALKDHNFEFRFVGPIAPEATRLAQKLHLSATFIPKQPQRELPRLYAWGDLFFLPTIEDGFQTVLSQAAASALPILTTPNGAGWDLVQDEQNGWVLPIRSPESFVDRLQWCDTHREQLAAMVQHIYDDFRPRDWSDVAKDFETLCESMIRERTKSVIV